jgi:type IV pilus assembly protein PilM
MFPFTSGNLIGVDIGYSTVKVVKLRGKKGSYRLEAAACMRVPQEVREGSGPTATLREILSAQKIRARRAASAIGSPFLECVTLKLPQMPAKDLKEAVRWEVRKEVRVPDSELVTDYIIREDITGAGGKLPLIAFASKKTDIQHMVEIFKDASIELRVIDSPPTALLAAFDANNEWESGVNYAMLDIGCSHSTLAVFKDRTLRFVRIIHFGGNDLTRALANALNKAEEEAEAYKISFGLAASAAPSEQRYAEPQYEGSDADEEDRIRGILKESLEHLAAEVTRSFDYHHVTFREGSISKLFLCGGTAALKGIDKYLTDILGVACFVDDPLRNVTIPRGFDRDGLKVLAPFLTVATGLATRRDTL